MDVLKLNGLRLGCVLHSCQLTGAADHSQALRSRRYCTAPDVVVPESRL